jgi:serine protease Do
MTGWIAATAASALIGVTAGPLMYGQSMELRDSGDALSRVIELTQGAPFAGGSSQLGVSVRDVEDADLKSGKAGAPGVVIDDVETASPAEKAGFKAGDIVVEFDGDRVRSTRQFVRLVQETPSGRQVSVVVARDGQRVTLSVQPREGNTVRYFDGWNDFKFQTLPKLKAAPVPLKRGEFLFAIPGRLGISVDDLSPQLADYFGTKDGVLVTSVTDNSNASKAGLKAGDVITSVDGQTIASASDLRTRTQRLESGSEFTLGVVRDKKTMTLKGKMEQAPSPRRVMRTIL